MVTTSSADSHVSRDLKRSLTLRFSSLLFLFLALSGGTYFVVSTAVSAKEYDSVFVNVAGRQRMLTQKYARHIDQVLVALAGSDRELVVEMKEAASQTAELYDATLAAFLEGGEVDAGEEGRIWIPPVQDDDLVQHLGHVKVAWEELQRTALQAVQSDGSPLARNDSVRDIETQTAEAVAAMDFVVFLMQKQSETRLRLVESYMAYACIVGVALFVGTVMFVRRKIVVPLANSMIALETESAEREQAEREVREAKDYTDNIIRSMIDMLVVVAPDGSIITVNDATCSLLGYRNEELIGRPASLLFSEEEKEEEEEEEDNTQCTLSQEVLPVKRTVLRRLERQGSISNIEKSLLTKNGDKIPVLLSGSVMRDNTRAIRGIVCVAQDITEQKKAEGTKAQLEGQLRQAQKMEAVGQLASGVAHDFNNLLTAITGYATLARSTLPAGHVALKSLEGVADAARQAAGVTRALLTFSHKTTASKEPIELHGLVEKSIHLLRRMLPAAIKVVMPPPAAAPVWIHADGTQVQQVVMNLAVNARDAMPQGGTLRISVAPAQEKESQPVGRTGLESPSPDTRLSGPVARLVVSDSGTGIAPEARERIFEPFFTTKLAGQGTGLGLAIVHSIVKDHAGRIDVQSEPGRGTRFTIEFPLRTEAHAPESVEPAPSPPNGEGFVLLVEDNWHVRTILTTALRSFGYDVVQASDGPSFLERFERHRDRFRLLLVDIDLPMRNGLDCLRDIRATGVRTPAIVITGKADAILESELDDDTFLLRKPFQISELSELAGRVLGAKPEEEVPA